VDEQHSVARTVVLHLLPGALITAFYVGAAPVVRSLGFPSLMAIFLAIAFVLIPFELGYLIYQARKNASTLGNVVLYRQPVPRGQFVALVLGIFAWWGICSVLLFPPLDEFFMETLELAISAITADDARGFFAHCGYREAGSMTTT
jgi:uncharacterized protein